MLFPTKLEKACYHNLGKCAGVHRMCDHQCTCMCGWGYAHAKLYEHVSVRVWSTWDGKQNYE